MANYAVGDSHLCPGGFTPVSDENPLPVGGAVLGAVDAVAEDDPAAETATIAQLLRGILAVLIDIRTNTSA